MHNQFKTQKFKHLMLAMGPRDLHFAPYSPIHCSSHSMTSFQSSELTEIPVVENSQLFAQRAHSARYAPKDLKRRDTGACTVQMQQGATGCPVCGRQFLFISATHSLGHHYATHCPNTGGRTKNGRNNTKGCLDMLLLAHSAEHTGWVWGRLWSCEARMHGSSTKHNVPPKSPANHARTTSIALISTATKKRKRQLHSYKKNVEATPHDVWTNHC